MLKEILKQDHKNINNEMNNKSFIQVQLEFVQAKSEFENNIKSILEKYDVQDSVFSINNRGTYELSNGYMVESKRFDSLNDAVRFMGIGQALRIVENKEFIVGNVYDKLTDCPESDHIFNVEFLEDVY